MHGSLVKCDLRQGKRHRKRSHLAQQYRIAYMHEMQARRQQPSITIRSDKAAALLDQLAKSGRSKVSIIEEALERLPVRPDHPLEAERRARIAQVLARLAARADVPSIGEFDRREYDARGNPR